MHSLLVVFAKSPRARNVKTRLAPLLTQKERAQLQKAFILDTLSLIAPLSVTRALACTPNTDDPFFTQCKKRYAVTLIKQEGTDLGERMENAFDWGFSRRFNRIVLIGSDSPTLPAPFIIDAFDRLKTVPVVLGPSTDGGYYLIGAKSPLPNLFQKIKWGSKTVLLDTIRRLRYYHLLPFWYDIDRPDDLAFLKEHLALLKRQRLPFAKGTWKTLRK